ncbi:MAG TPA: cupin domain-containing protein [Thermoanaerobaculia bacterium]|nr:cupin domain-containing protein [Thermoanaerobaculia bacterium]
MTTTDMTWIAADTAPVLDRFPGFRVRPLWTGSNGAKAQLVEMEAGAKWVGLERHEPGPEEVYVVSGIFNDGVRDYPAGTFIHNPAGSAHVPQSSSGCVLFLFYPEG